MNSAFQSSSICNMYGMDIWRRKCKYLSPASEMVLVDLSISLAGNNFPKGFDVW